MDSHDTRPPVAARRRTWLHRLLLALPAESAHNLAVGALRVAQSPPARGVLTRRYTRRDPALAQDGPFGQRFPNPIGLAAGFDKNGLVIPGMAALGFGWLEVGAVTPRPQKGNSRPRLFRYPDAESLENAMGFNNRGCSALARRLERHHPAPVPLYVNLGKNRDTPNEQALDDYLLLLEALERRSDGFVLNVSSPNTPGLRDLQERRAVGELVRAARGATSQPLLIKLSPDLEPGGARAVAEECAAHGVDGIVLANTTTDYGLLPEARRVGGLSGQVLKRRSLELLEALAPDLEGRCLLVSVGGIASGADVYRRLRAGANLVQLYTALVFAGPGLVRRMTVELAELLARDGFANVEEAVGADVRRGKSNKQRTRVKGTR